MVTLHLYFHNLDIYIKAKINFNEMFTHRSSTKKGSNGYKSFKEDSKAAIKATDSIMPLLNKIFKGECVSNEKTKNNLDLMHGIDIIVNNVAGRDEPIYVGARCQFGTNYKGFTLRFKRTTGTKTEIEKRIEQIESGELYPHFTYQAFFEHYEKGVKPKLLSIAVMKTKDLFKEIMESEYTVENRSDNVFLSLRWCYIKSHIQIYENIDGKIVRTR